MEEELDLFSFEEPEVICGADEAGRGPLAGPVTAAAVILPEDFPVNLLNDSKKLSEKQRLEAEIIIKQKAIWAITFIDNEEIDRINILNAALKAMAESYKEVCKQKKPDILYVDGNKLPPLENTAMKAIVKGDAKIPAIMAASILAKCARDRFMDEMDEKYPGYDFKKNKGYPSKAHQKALEELGQTPIHRKSFHLKKKDKTTLL